MQEKNAQLEKSLSSETKLKMDLFSALGDAKRELSIASGKTMYSGDSNNRHSAGFNPSHCQIKTTLDNNICVDYYMLKNEHGYVNCRLDTNWSSIKLASKR